MGLFLNLLHRGSIFSRKPHAWRHHHWRFRRGLGTWRWCRHSHQRLPFVPTWRWSRRHQWQLGHGASQTGALKDTLDLIDLLILLV